MRRDPAVVCLSASANGRGAPDRPARRRVRDVAGEGARRRALDSRRRRGRRKRGIAAGVRAGARRPAVRRASSGSTKRRARGPSSFASSPTGRPGPANRALNGPQVACQPATAADAKGLLSSAIRDPEPVSSSRRRDLYTVVCDGVPEGDARRGAGGGAPGRAGKRRRRVRPRRRLGRRRAGRAGPQRRGRGRRRADAVARSTARRSTRRCATPARSWSSPSPARHRDSTATLVRLIYEELPQYLDAPIRELGGPPCAEDSERPLGRDVKEACTELVAF